MKNLWQKRRELFKHLYVRGIKTEKSADDEVLIITDSSDQGFEKIRIYGKTSYTPLDLSQALMNEVARKDAYIGSGVTGAMAVAIPTILCERELTYTPVILGDMGSHSVFLADGSSFLFSSTHTLISNGVASQVTVKDYPYIIVTGIVDEADMDSVLSAFTIEVEGTTLYQTKSLNSPLVELYGKNLINLLDEKTNGAATVLEKTKDYLKLEARGSHRLHAIGLGIDGERLNPRALRVSTEYNVSSASIRGFISVRWLDKRGFDIYNKGISGAVPVREGTGRITAKGTLNCVLDTEKEQLLYFTFYSNSNGLSDYPYSTIEYIKPMLRLDGTDDDYEEYREPIKIRATEITLASGGGVYDYLEIDKAEKRVLYHKLVAELQIDKSESEQEVLNTPQVYDFSDTEWGKSLLNLSVPYGCDGYLWVEGASKIECEYFTVKNENKYTLTVCYNDEEGQKIEAKRIYNVRKGSVYKITPPHINGYVALSQQVVGTISQNTEITLIYKKEEA